VSSQKIIQNGFRLKKINDIREQPGGEKYGNKS
jgi:hypothetical protein